MTSERSLQITPFLVMDVLERAQEFERAGKRVIHLEAGEPDFDTPEVIKEAAVRALKEGKTHYTHSMGLLELREAICEHYWDWYRVRVSPDCIVITAGSSPAIQLSLLAVLDRGDEVVLSDPGYPCYSNMIVAQEGVPLRVEVSEDDEFQFHPETIARRISPRTKGILLNSPANPTGMILSSDRMREIARLGPMLLSDEIYHGLTYGEKAHSVLEFTDRALVFNGFSKLCAMTGWRLGYVIIPKELARTVQKIHQNFSISANAFVQWAGIAALRSAGAEVDAMVALYDERRKVMVEGLRKLGFGIKHLPKGAFYVFAGIGGLGGDSLKLSMDILEKVYVGVAPGIDFGAHGEGYMRFCYANSRENIEEALNRLEKYVSMR